jgi:F0F1-type ATP synthase assembly protein I
VIDESDVRSTARTAKWVLGMIASLFIGLCMGIVSMWKGKDK